MVDRVFADSLYKLLQERNLGPVAFANLVGVERCTIQRYLRAEMFPRADILCAMADALGVSMDRLWRGE